MRKIASYVLAVLLANFVTIAAFAQTTISGNIINSVNGESVSAVSVTIKGASNGTFTDDKGNFKIAIDKKLPVTLMFTSVGFALQEVTVNNAQPVTVQFVPSNSLGQEVVVSATKVAQR
ncbi:MAG: carboxypeptidase-like regulatory domain-containing protein, partial [Aquabacterium sp.]|nr:carboxypeptidase-like regulatory domain-containing protein [Ferruginibacter sp.]